MGAEVGSVRASDPLSQSRGVLSLALALVAFIVSGRAQQTQRYLYAALPGVGGGNNMAHGGAGILVFDIDNGHKFVERVPLEGVAPPPGRGDTGPHESVKGIAASAEPPRLYVSTGRGVAAYDLLKDKLVWEQSYENRGTDRVTISPD